MKRLYNLKAQAIIFIVYSVFCTILYYLYPEKLENDTDPSFTILAYFVTVIYGPITEEIIYRYWAYGKNIQLQFAIFFTFILYNLIDFIQFLNFDILNISEDIDINVVIKNSLVILVGLFLYLFIKKTNYNIPSLFETIIRSRLTFLFIIILFEYVHLIKYEDIFDFVQSIFVSYLITRHARDYGIYYAMLIHALHNSLATLDEAIGIREVSKLLVSQQLIINYSLISAFILIIYLIQFLKAKPCQLIQR